MFLYLLYKFLYTGKYQCLQFVGFRQDNHLHEFMKMVGFSMFINSLHLVNTHISIKVLILNMPHFMPVCFKSSFIR